MSTWHYFIRSMATTTYKAYYAKFFNNTLATDTEVYLALVIY